MKTLTTLLCAVILNSTFFILHSFATSYTWNGTTSTAWSTTTNWTPNGTPGSGDNVTIVTTGNQPALSGNVTVTAFTITSGTLNLGGYTLNVSGTLAANGGTITNGTLNASGSATATFAGTVFNCTVTVVCNDVYLNGSEFNAPASFTKNSSGDNYSNGGNTFNDAFTIIHNGSGILGLGISQADEFNATASFTANDGYLVPAAASSGNTFADDVYLFCSGTDGILMNYSGTASYSGNIYLACDDAGGTISFGQSGGSATLASGKTLVKDAAGFDLGQLIFNNFTKYGTTAINLAFGDYTALTLGAANVFNGSFTFSGGHYYLNGTTFNHAVSFSQNYDLDSYSSGGNTFNGNAEFINNSANDSYLANATGDDFNGNVTFEQNSTGLFFPGYNGTTTYAGNITANGANNCEYGYGAALSRNVLDGSTVQYIGGTAPEHRFLKLTVNKPAGYVDLESPVGILDSLVLTDGIVKTTTIDYLMVRNNAKAIGASDSSHVEGIVVKGGDDAFTYPVGRNGHYRPISMSAPAMTSDLFYANYLEQNSNDTYSHSAKDGSIAELSRNEYWELVRYVGSSNVSVTLSWDTVTTSCSFASAANLKVCAWDGSQWKDRGNGGTTGNLAAGTVISSGTSSSYVAYTLGTSSLFYCCGYIQANAGHDIYLMPGDTVEIGSREIPGLIYTWSTSDGLSDSTVSNPLAYPTENTNYILSVSDGFGCVVKDSILITTSSATLADTNFAFCGYSRDFVQLIDDADFLDTIAPPETRMHIIDPCGTYFYVQFDDENGEGFDDPVLGEARRNCLCDVLQYIESVIDIPAGPQINIHILPSGEINNNPDVLAVAGATNSADYYNGVDGIYPGNIHTRITTGEDGNENLPWDAFIQVNFDHNFSLCSAPVENCNYDLFTVLLHEVLHTMGIASLIRENSTTLLPVSFTGEDQYTLYDWLFLHHGDITNPASFEKLIEGSIGAPVINTNLIAQAGVLRDGQVWLHDGGQFTNNQPVYSGNFTGSVAYNGILIFPGSLISHLDGMYLSFTFRGALSPGYHPHYVMKPTMNKGESIRELSLPEIRILLEMGYSLNASFASSTTINGIDDNEDIINANSPPYTTKQTTNDNLNSINYPDIIQTADFTIDNDGTPLEIILANDIEIIDPDNDDVIVEPGTLFNIRGCGSGNNHNQLELLEGGAKIRYTPRADFIGRAQFGFYLYDGKERGSFMLYTIDVEPGVNFINTSNPNTPLGEDELVVNGDCEEGTEVKTFPGNEYGPYTSIDDALSNWEGAYYIGVTFPDAHPLLYTNYWWTSSYGGLLIRDSYKSCGEGTYPARFGTPPFNFSDPDNWHNPLPNNNIGNRYQYLMRRYNYFRLAAPVTNGSYLLIFDINFENSELPAGSDYPVTIGFTDEATHPAIAYDYSIFTQITVGSGWQTITVPVLYCPEETSIFMNIEAGNTRVLMDNISLTEAPVPLTVTIADPGVLCGNSEPIFLTADIPGGIWSGDGIVGIGNENTTGEFDPFLAGGGIHNITYTLCFELTDDIDITVTDPIALTLSSADAECDCSGSAEITAVTNGSEPFTYAWAWVQQNQTVSTADNAGNLCPGIYIITLTDIDNCAVSETVIINNAGGTAGINAGTWPKQGASDEKVRVHTVLADEFGNVYITGYFYTGDDADIDGFSPLTPNTAINMFVAKYSFDGNSDWIRQFGNDTPDPFTTDNTGFDLAIGVDCKLIVTGKYDYGIDLDAADLLGTSLQGFIMKLDPADGTVVASANLPRGISFQAVAVSAITGNIYTMSKELDSYPDHNVVITQFDQDLNFIDDYTFGVVGPDDMFGVSGDVTRGIGVDGDDNVYVTVNLTSAYIDFGTLITLDDAAVAKFDIDLNEVNGINLTSAGYTVVYDIATDASGVSFVVGATNLRVSELAASLASVSNTYTYNTGATGTSIDIDAVNFYFCGMESGTDVHAGKALRSNGSAVFSNSFTSDESACNSVSADIDGNAFIAGAFTDEMIFDNATLTATDDTWWDMFAARLDESTGESFKTDEENNNSQPLQQINTDRNREKFSAEVYPNPTNGRLYIGFNGISERDKLTIEVYDPSGAVVKYHALFAIQGNVAELDMSDFSNGVYLLKISAGANRIFNRVNLVK